jgi:tripartite-type tricarboxylate transporter receptor subunit TctC
MRRISRRGLLASTAALIAAPSIVRAQAWPGGQVRIVVGFPPGGAADIVARLAATRLAEIWKVNVVVDNKPGAGGNVAGAEVVRTPPDGANLLITSSSAAVSKLLYRTMAYDPFTDLAPVTMAVSIPNVMVVPAASPDKSIADFIARAKASPGKLNFGSAGIGSSIHLSGELFKHLARIDITHVPYRGAAPAVNDLIGGQIQVAFTELATSLGHVKAGKLRALAVTTAARTPVLPDVPTLSEFIPGFEASQWIGLVGPKGTPPAIVEKVNASINAGLADAKLKARFAELGGMVLPGSPADFGKLIRDETEKWGKVIKDAHIKQI